MTWDNLTALVSIGAVVVSASLGLRTLSRNIRINLRNKRVDVVMHCNARYDAIYESRMKIRNFPAGTELDASLHSYYARYWGLKSDEFDYWLADLIDLETYCNWSFMTMKAFQENDSVSKSHPEMNFLWGWKKVGRNDNLVTNEWFYELTEATREVARLWDEIAKSHKELRSSPLLRGRLYDEMIDILEIVFKESEEYRSTLLDGIGFLSYRKTLRLHPALGLSIADRKSNIQSELEILVQQLKQDLPQLIPDDPSSQDG